METTALEEELPEPSLSQSISKKALLDVLGLVGQALVSTLGDWCEVVVHDLADLEHSIVCISGNLTGRKVGGHLADFGLGRLRSGTTDPVFNSTSYTDDGKTLKSSHIFIHGENGQPIAAFCINLNLTSILVFERFLSSLTLHKEEASGLELLSEDWTDMVEALIAEAAYAAGKPLPLMTKGDRMRMVSWLDDKGVFQLKGSVPLVAKRLGVTRKTIYNYLSALGRSRDSVDA